jgi:hypothetical protein
VFESDDRRIESLSSCGENSCGLRHRDGQVSQLADLEVSDMCRFTSSPLAVFEIPYTSEWNWYHKDQRSPVVEGTSFSFELPNPILETF